MHQVCETAAAMADGHARTVREAESEIAQLESEQGALSQKVRLARAENRERKRGMRDCSRHPGPTAPTEAHCATRGSRGRFFIALGARAAQIRIMAQALDGQKAIIERARQMEVEHARQSWEREKAVLKKEIEDTARSLAEVRPRIPPQPVSLT